MSLSWFLFLVGTHRNIYLKPAGGLPWLSLPVAFPFLCSGAGWGCWRRESTNHGEKTKQETSILGRTLKLRTAPSTEIPGLYIVARAQNWLWHFKLCHTNCSLGTRGAGLSGHNAMEALLFHCLCVLVHARRARHAHSGTTTLLLSLPICLPRPWSLNSGCHLFPYCPMAKWSTVSDKKEGGNYFDFLPRDNKGIYNSVFVCGDNLTSD